MSDKPLWKPDKVVARLVLEVRANGCYSAHITGPDGTPILGEHSYYSPRQQARIQSRIRYLWDEHVANMRDMGRLDT